MQLWLLKVPASLIDGFGMVHLGEALVFEFSGLG